jgi:hypothetical protein
MKNRTGIKQKIGVDAPVIAKRVAERSEATGFVKGRDGFVPL